MFYRIFWRFFSAIILIFFGTLVFNNFPISAFAQPLVKNPQMVIIVPDDPTPTPTTAPTPTPTTGTSSTTHSTPTPTKKKSTNSSSSNTTSTKTTGTTPTPTTSASGITITVTTRDIVGDDSQKQPFNEIDTIEILSTDNLSFTGTTSPANLAVKINCQNFEQSVSSDAQGAWQFLLSPKDNNLTVGNYTCTAYAQNDKGDKSDTVTLANFKVTTSLATATAESQKSLFSSVYFWLLLILLLLLIALLLWWLRRRKKGKDKKDQKNHPTNQNTKI